MTGVWVFFWFFSLLLGKNPAQSLNEQFCGRNARASSGVHFKVCLEFFMVIFQWQKLFGVFLGGVFCCFFLLPFLFKKEGSA